MLIFSGVGDAINRPPKTRITSKQRFFLGVDFSQNFPINSHFFVVLAESLSIQNKLNWAVADRNLANELAEQVQSYRYNR